MLFRSIAIEAALAAMNRAPGINRKFAAQSWSFMGKDVWEQAFTEAKDKEYSGDYDIWGGDIDPKCIEISKENARRAGVSRYVRFETAEAADFFEETPGGMIITNPPYGERVMEKEEAERIYRRFGQAVTKLDNWKLYILSSHTEFERTFGRQATKKRKLYNGMIKCDLFMYF